MRNNAQMISKLSKAFRVMQFAQKINYPVGSPMELRATSEMKEVPVRDEMKEMKEMVVNDGCKPKDLDGAECR